MSIKHLLLSLFLITASFFSALAYDCQVDGLYYNLDHVNKTAAITYKKDFLKASYKNKKEVIIPSTITFNNTSYTVNSIDGYAFYDCTSLNSVSIPESVTSIGNSAFQYCNKLKSIILPTSLTVIGNSAFEGCLSLTSISIPNSVTSIWNSAFQRCIGLKSVVLPNTITSIEDYTFEGCDSLLSISIPNSVTTIGIYAFASCKQLKSIDLPKSLISIGAYAFYNCDSLTSIVIPNSTTSIGNYAFYGCDFLKSIVIPNSITSYGKEVLKWCRSLKSITIKSPVFNWADLETISHLKEICVSPDLVNSIPHVYKQLAKTVMPFETIDEYFAANPFISWNEYYAARHTKELPLSDKESINRLISTDIENWQKKGEFESTSNWTQRVNEKTRAARIDSLKNYYSINIRRQQNDYKQEAENLQKLYETEYKAHYDSLTTKFTAILFKLKTDEFTQETFDLSAPYDADNQSFLIKTGSFGDVLLPVPVNEAPDFKNNWENIKRNIKPTFAFDGKNAVLSKITFSLGPQNYVYDSHTEARYAVADINYNFTPLEVGMVDFDISDIDIQAPAIDYANIAHTVAKKNDSSTLNKKKVEVERKSITVGNGTPAASTNKSDVDITIPRVAGTADKTFALVIANENYRREGNVMFAQNDGKIFAEYLKATLGLPEKNLQLYLDASLNDIKFGLNKLAQICDAFGGDANVIVYYAGHGIPDEKNGDAYLLPVDGYGSDVSTGYSVKDLYETLGKLQSKQTLLLMDACFSGSQRDGNMMASNARGVRLKPKTHEAVGNLIVLSATQGDETAYPYEDKQHGLFTYFLLKKLNESKRSVTLGDLSDYIIANVKRTSILTNDKLQTPTVYVSPTLGTSWKSMRLTE